MVAAAASIGLDAVASSCAHCALPIPSGRSGPYCCEGCEVVYEAIAEHRLDAFYALRERPAPAHTTSASYAELDDPAFHRVHVRTRSDGTRQVALYLDDLRCTACVWLVEATPKCIPGVRDVRVDLGRSRAEVCWNPNDVSLSTIARHLDRIGHAVHPYRGLDRDRARRREDRALLIKLGVAGAAAGNLMLIAIALYAGAMGSGAGSMSTDETMLFRWASMVVAVPALGFAATPMFRTALGALYARRLHLDLPLSIGILAGLGWGSANVLRGTGEIYFDSLAMLVFLLLVSRWIVLRHQRRASTAAELLLALTPSRARRIDPATGAIVEVPVDAIQIGDSVEVTAGSTIPVDGEVIHGESAIDNGLLTGESRPADIAIGDRVYAGTRNIAGPLRITATAVGEDTRVGALAATICDLSVRRSAIERFVDRVAGRFVAVVTAAAVLTFTAWSFISPALGAEHAIALLVVTCPCALSLATPLAVTVALGRAARRGILIKGADALERLATPGTLFIDKTGTLTEGRLTISTWLGDTAARALASTLEAASSHPIARAFTALPTSLSTTDTEAASSPPIASSLTAPLTSLSTADTDVASSRPSRQACAVAAIASPAANEVREELGKGITGIVRDCNVAVGAPAWVRARCTKDTSHVEAWVEELTRRGETPIAVAVDGAIVAMAGLADPIRADAASALAALAALGWKVEILSGDDPRVVRAVGAALALSPERCAGEISPEGKLARVQAARTQGPVVMVGDGVNDAAAMAAATCGIAVSGAAELAIETADIYLRSPSVGAIAKTASAAVATLATIRRSLRFSLGYNVIVGALAAVGAIHPLLAAVVMPASSLIVLANSLSSRAFRAEVLT